MLKKIKKNLLYSLIIVISFVYILFGIYLIIDGVFFNNDISGAIEVGLGIMIFISYLLSTAFTYFGMKKKNDNFVLVGVILYSTFAILLLSMLFSIELLNIALIVFSFILLILSSINYGLLTKK
ncbi:MAG: hypothetical protein GX758_01495 [Tenericutes bacterium]|nr:hypothetical protein [Mycoplasmatota bacterium]